MNLKFDIVENPLQFNICESSMNIWIKRFQYTMKL